jgi:hypothetical protein
MAMGKEHVFLVKLNVQINALAVKAHATDFGREA